MPFPRTAAQTLCGPAQSKCTSTCHKSRFITRKFTGKKGVPQNSGADFVRATNACQGFTRATLYGNLQEKCRSPKPRPTLCASLRSRNACQDFTRATLCGNLQEKCVRPDWAPRSSTGLYTYRKNPSVWTHCLGKNKPSNPQMLAQVYSSHSSLDTYPSWLIFKRPERNACFIHPETKMAVSCRVNGASMINLTWVVAIIIHKICKGLVCHAFCGFTPFPETTRKTVNRPKSTASSDHHRFPTCIWLYMYFVHIQMDIIGYSFILIPSPQNITIFPVQSPLLLVKAH